MAQQELATYQDLQLRWPYGSIHIQHLEFTQPIGSHARLQVTGIINEAQEDKILSRAGLNDAIELILRGDERRPLFKGLLYNVQVRVVRDIHYVTIESMSHTYRMDTQAKTRSFQQANCTYHDIVERVLSSYPDGDMIDLAFEKSRPDQFIMQYQETDWAFLKRLATHAGSVLIPDVTAHQPRFWVGLPESRTVIKLDQVPYEVERDIAPYLLMNASGQAKTEASHYTTYIFEYPAVLQLGDRVQQDGTEYLITKRQCRMEQGLLKWSYECSHPKGIRILKAYNTSIIGAAIEGRVIGVSRQQVRLHLDMDDTQQAQDASWFPYSAEGNQVWYLMPEIGSRIKLYFPSADEDDAMAIQSVRQPPQGEYVQKSEQQMSNPAVKSFGNPQGKQFTLGDKELSLTAQEGVLSITMVDVGVRLTSNSNIQINSAGDLTLSSAGRVMIRALKDLSVKSTTSSIDLIEEANVQSPKIDIQTTSVTAFPYIQSDFELEVAKVGLESLIVSRDEANKQKREDSGTSDWKDTAIGAWNTLGDLLKMSSSGHPSEQIYRLVHNEPYEPTETEKYIIAGTKTNINYVLGNIPAEEYWGEKKENWDEDVTRPIQNFLDNGLSSRAEGILQMVAPSFTPQVAESLKSRTHYTKTDQELIEMGQRDASFEGLVLGTASGGIGGVTTKTTKSIADGVNERRDNNNSDSDNRTRGDVDLNNDSESATNPIKTGKLLTNTKSVFDILSRINIVGLFLRQMTESALSRFNGVNQFLRTDKKYKRVPIDPAKFERMKKHFERQGGVIMQGPEVTDRLERYQAEASNIGPDIIMHRDNPTTSAVFEEFIHSTQNRTGRATGDNWLEMEIEAQEKLIRFRKAYGIPNNETRQTIEALKEYRRLLSEK